MEDIEVLSSEEPDEGATQSVNDNSEKINGEDRSTQDTGIKCKVNLGTGNTICCVSNCPTNLLRSVKKSQITFVTFPKDPSRFTEWTRAIERPDLLAHIGKKDATNLLVCSRHFPEHMWVNSSTRIKRLHKNAVPEIDSEDEFDIIAVTPANIKKGGLKVKKVSALLSESALRESLSPVSGLDSSRLSENRPSSLRPPSKRGRKWPTILQKPKVIGSTEMEKKLISDNEQLKSELDKNMDYILSQKAHYEGLLLQEKKKSQELENKVKGLETAQNKLWHTYESQLQAQRTVVNSKAVGQQEMNSRLKLLQQKNDEVEHKVSMLQAKCASLERVKTDLEWKIEEMTTEETLNQPPPPVEKDFTGEKFKNFVYHFLQKEKHLQEEIETLVSELENKSVEEEQDQLFKLAQKHLDTPQLKWFEAFINKEEGKSKQLPNSFRELCLSLYENSETGYVVCANHLGLPSLSTVRQWAKEVNNGISTAHDIMDTIFDERTRPYKKNIPRTFDEVETRGSGKNRRHEVKSPPIKRKRKPEKTSEEEEDSAEEGIVSDEDEEIHFSEDSEDEGERKKHELKPCDFSVPSSSSNVQPQPHPQADFDFMIEAEDESNTDDGNLQIGNSMPLLVPDSPMTPVPSVGHQSEVKVAGRKKVISDSSLTTGHKVVFRVIE